MNCKPDAIIAILKNLTTYFTFHLYGPQHAMQRVSDKGAVYVVLAGDCLILNSHNPIPTSPHHLYKLYTDPDTDNLGTFFFVLASDSHQEGQFISVVMFVLRKLH
jgi:hypothetical protein